MEDRRPHILVMEDDPNLSELYAEALGLEGYRVDTARTIANARTLLETNTYKVFLCDMQIGRDRSTDLLKDILDESTHMQVIMLSGLGQYQAEAMAMGVDFFLAKPVEIPELVALIDRLAKQPIPPSEEEQTADAPPPTPQAFDLPTGENKEADAD